MSQDGLSTQLFCFELHALTLIQKGRAPFSVHLLQVVQTSFTNISLSKSTVLTFTSFWFQLIDGANLTTSFLIPIPTRATPIFLTNLDGHFSIPHLGLSIIMLDCPQFQHVPTTPIGRKRCRAIFLQSSIFHVERRSIMMSWSSLGLRWYNYFPL